MPTRFEGGCHCGRVRFQVTADLDRVTECNCSVCTKKGILHLIVPPDQFQVLSGEDELTVYQFNTHTARHQFCRHCGMHPFYVPRSDPDKIDVNVRCLDGVDLRSLRVLSFDGRNWEQALTAAPWRDQAGADDIMVASVADREALLGLMRLFYRGEKLRFDEALTPRALRTLLEEPWRGRVLVAKEGNEAIGYGVLTIGYSLEFMGADAFVDELFVVQRCRGRGVGRRLTEALESLCRTLKVRALHLEVDHTNPRARAAYERWGWKAHDRSLMTKPLPGAPEG